MPADIFPQVGSPTIYVAQPYGGMDPAQMEGYMTYYYEYHFLYITGIEHVESKSIQGAALMKLVFHPGTDMAQALAQTVAYVNRSRSFMPPGAVPPFVTRFDPGSVPVGQLVFSSPTKTPGEMQDIAINRVRPLFATLPGVSAPPPFGGNQRTIVVRLDPGKLRQYNMSPEEVITAVNKSSIVMPNGVVRTGTLARFATTNAVVGGNFDDLAGAPVRTGQGPTVYIRDVAVVENGTDIITAYAHINGKRTVYIPVTKRSDASTLAVIQAVRGALPAMQAVCPDDVKISLEFDQSGYVAAGIRNLVNEGMLGALLTGLMALLFLRDWRSALIVIVTIPVALLSAVILLWVTGQTVNIMVLSGLALAVGVLVDEATVEIENIHSRLGTGVSRAQAVLEACKRTAAARFLSMLCVLAVFAPSLFMSGVAKQLFTPLALAVAFAMMSSYVLSSTLVPVLAVGIMRRGHEAAQGALAGLYRGWLRMILALRWPVVAGYLLLCGLLLWTMVPQLGVELFPAGDTRQYQLRLRAPTGTRIERTELYALKALDLIKETVGAERVAITSGFIGVQPASYPVNLLYLWTSGPHEAVLAFTVKPGPGLIGEPLREKLRERFKATMPDALVSFEAGDIVSQVMSFGSPTPIEVAVQGPSLPNNRAFAAKIYNEVSRIDDLRDVQYAQPMDYPTLDITIDRDRAGQFGLTMANVTRSVLTATSSSRFFEPNYWRDPASGNAFQIQVEIPQNRMQSMEDLGELPVMNNGASRPLLSDVATLKNGTAMGMVDRYNMQRVISITANPHAKPLGAVQTDLATAIHRAGKPPQGVAVAVRGQIPALRETMAGLETGLWLALATIFLLLAAYFQSFRLAVAVLCMTPAVLCGAVLALSLTGTTLNIQSYLGAIMATGIAVANAILLVTFAEAARRETKVTSREAAEEAGVGRVRAVLMTAAAMIAGMVPLAMASGEGGAQTAPLGRAVIGGLIGATIATLTVLPALYAILQAGADTHSASLDPEDPASKYYAH